MTGWDGVPPRAGTDSIGAGAVRDDGVVTRIVAGQAGGRRLVVPPRGTRPTSERVREALFSALESTVDIEGAHVLDLYAGSGALGLEALSRGAARVVLVEHDRRAVQVLRRNVSTVGLPGAEVLAAPVAAALGTPAGTPFDVVLADPPYAVSDAELGQVLAALLAGAWTEPDSVVIVERDARAGPPPWPDPLRPLRSRRYGDTELHWAEHHAP